MGRQYLCNFYGKEGENQGLFVKRYIFLVENTTIRRYNESKRSL